MTVDARTVRLAVGLALALVISVQVGSVAPAVAQDGENAIVDGCSSADFHVERWEEFIRSGKNPKFLNYSIDTLINGRNPEACKELDRCYDTPGMAKATCDDEFRSAAIEQCLARDSENTLDEALCIFQAKHFRQNNLEYNQRQRRAYAGVSDCQLVFESGNASRSEQALCSTTLLAVPYFGGCLAAFHYQSNPISFCAFYDYAWSNDWYLFNRCDGAFRGSTTNPMQYLTNDKSVCENGQRT